MAESTAEAHARIICLRELGASFVDIARILDCSPGWPKYIWDRRQRDRIAGSVYFVQVGARGPIKIGYSADPVARFEQLIPTVPYRLHLRHHVPARPVMEHYLHGWFDAHRIWGEWFRPAVRVRTAMTLSQYGLELLWKQELEKQRPICTKLLGDYVIRRAAADRRQGPRT